MALIVGAFIAFGAGAYLSATYPSWPQAIAIALASVPWPGLERLPGLAPAAGNQVARPEQTEAVAATAGAQIDEPGTVGNSTASGDSDIPANSVPEGTATPSPQAAEAPAVSDAPPTVDESRSESAAREAIAPPLAGVDTTFSGEWSLNIREESNGLASSEGPRVLYLLRLQQAGNRMAGTGYKIRENDRALEIQAPVTLSGDVMADRIVLTFRERGANRESTGKLILYRESNDLLRGRFSNDATQSSRIAEAARR